MPTRYLKPDICDSEHIDALTAEEESFYYRLIVQVDDFGRLDARPAVVRSKCYPIKESLKSKTVEKWLSELSVKNMLIVYKTDKGAYLQLLRWTNKPRASESKYPAYDDSCIQLYTDVKQLYTDAPLTVTVTETVTVNRASRFDAFWKAYPKKKNKGQAEKTFYKINPNTEMFDKIITGVNLAKVSKEWLKDNGEFIPHPSTWLNAKGWEDEYIDESKHDDQHSDDPIVIQIEKLKERQENGEQLQARGKDIKITGSMFEVVGEDVPMVQTYGFLNNGGIITGGEG